MINYKLITVLLAFIFSDLVLVLAYAINAPAISFYALWGLIAWLIKTVDKKLELI